MSKKDQIQEDESPQEPDAGPSSFFPEETGTGLSKEVKIGVAVLLGLLTVLGAVVVKKWRRAADPPAATEEHASKPDDRAGDKAGPKVPPPSGPGFKAPEPTPLAGKAGTSSLASSPTSWNTPSSSDFGRHRDPPGDGRLGASPPSPMPKSNSFASGPNSNPSSQPAGLDKAGPPSPRFNDVVNSGPRSSDAFDPLGKQPSTPGLGNSPGMTPVSSSPGSSAIASGTDSRMSPERHPRHGSSFASSPTTLPTRDISDLSAPPMPGMAPPAGASSSVASNDPRFGSPRAAMPDASMPPASNLGSAPGGFRPSSGSLAASSPASPPSNFGRPDMPRPRSLESGPGLQPDGTYRIQPTDSYWTISKRLYGTGDYFRALAEHNRSKFPDENRLTPNDTISAPSAAELERNYPRLCAKQDGSQPAPERPLVSNASLRTPAGPRVYTVQEGDNLFNIAKYELHNATRWVEIYDLNRDLLGAQVDRLKPGMRLTLPEAAAPAARTAGRDSDPRR